MSGAFAALAIAFAVPVGAHEREAMPEVQGWRELSDTVRDLPERLLKRLPEERRNDPQVQQDVARLVMESLAVALIDALGGDGDHPVFVPNQNPVLNFPMPNTDTIYRTARITPGGAYRLRGDRGSLTMASLVQIGARPEDSGQAKASPTRSFLDLKDLRVDEKGRFDLILSSTRPPGYDGDWWALGETTSSLLIRMVSADWSKERDPTLSIERIDRPTRASRPAAADLERRLRAIPRAVEALPTMFSDHFEKLKAKGLINRVEAYDLSRSGGMAGQSYYEGIFAIGPGEALLMEVKAPEHCTYWSVILGDELHRTIDWVNNHSSLNNTQARPDSDGILRFVISDRDPGVPNWLDTAGHARGVVQGRWTQCDTQPVPTIRKIALEEVRGAVPGDTPVVTPDHRDRIVRERRAAFLSRPFW